MKTRKDLRRATTAQRTAALQRAKKIFDDFVAENSSGDIDMRDLIPIQQIVDDIGSGCIKFDMDGDDSVVEFMFCPGMTPRMRQTKKKTDSGIILPRALHRGKI